MQIDRMMVVFPTCESMMLIAKLETFVSKINNLKGVQMNQGWGSHERNLQRLKDSFIFYSSCKRLILLKQMNKGGHYHGTMYNEKLVEFNKSKKTLNITDISWGNQIHNGLNLVRIYANVIFKDDVLKEFQFGLMKFTFFQFVVEFDFFGLVHNKSHMSFMFFHIF